MNCISCERLLTGYDKKPVSSEISFEIRKGDYLCITGENGAGKSTLVKTMLGLIKPISGEIKYNNFVLGYLPQQTEIQRDFPATVWEIVLSGNIGRLKGRFFYSKKEKSVALEAMESLDIVDLKSLAYKNLSGGQQQRVLIARALCTGADILFLDEPITGLDPIAAENLYKLIEELNKKGATIIMVTHDVDTAVKYASHILHIGKEKVSFGEKKMYFEGGKKDNG